MVTQKCYGSCNMSEPKFLMGDRVRFIWEPGLPTMGRGTAVMNRIKRDCNNIGGFIITHYYQGRVTHMWWYMFNEVADSVREDFLEPWGPEKMLWEL